MVRESIAFFWFCFLSWTTIYSGCFSQPSFLASCFCFLPSDILFMKFLLAQYNSKHNPIVSLVHQRWLSYKNNGFLRINYSYNLNYCITVKYKVLNVKCQSSIYSISCTQVDKNIEVETPAVQMRQETILPNYGGKFCFQ